MSSLLLLLLDSETEFVEPPVLVRPTVPAVADIWYDELAVTQPADPQLGWPFLIFLGGLATTFGPLHDIVRDTPDGPGWSRPLDPSRATRSELAFLAQFAGVKLTPGAETEQWRQEITSPPAFARGTAAALVSAAQVHLTGNKLVTVNERDGGAYQLSVTTRTSETPDPAAVERALQANKPAGLILTYSTVAGQTWNEVPPTMTWNTAPAGRTWDQLATTPL